MHPNPRARPRFTEVDGSRICYWLWDGSGAVPTLCLHGFPTSGYLFRLAALEMRSAGPVIAPDLPGFGQSELGDREGTWEEMVDFLEAFVEQLGIEQVRLVVHDWGGLIGLRWACDHPHRIAALVITNTGFFADGRWHDLAQTLRTEGAGEQFLEQVDREMFAQQMQALCPAVPEDALSQYWQGVEGPTRARAKLALYRSGDFEKLEPYEGKLNELGVPTLILFGSQDPLIPVAAAERFQREIDHAELDLRPAGHFLWEEIPDELGSRIAEFLQV